jgi:membrane associated rhomboid family serine protease
MFPIRDNVPSRSFPVVTVALIAANTAVFLYEVALGSRGLAGFISHNALIPDQVTVHFSEAASAPREVFLPFFTAMFLHGGWLHLIGNMWYLWIFGDNVEDRLGHVKFLVFYVLCGLLGNVAHYALNTASTLPALGASGAIAGVLGAYVVSYPGARILVLLPIFFFIQFVELPALVVLGFWFVLQFLSGAASVAATGESGGTAWWAHIGGFLGGMALFYLFRPRPRSWYVRR